MTLTPLRAAGLAGLLVAAAGCTKPETAVTGTVQYQGRPLTGGSVILYCENKQIVHGLIGPDGTYAIPNVPRGVARVTVRAHGQVPAGFNLRSQLPPVEGGPVRPDLARPARPADPVIPGRYGLPEESDLSVRVDGAGLTYDIHLHS